MNSTTTLGSSETLLIADDHPIFRQGLKHALGSVERMSVVAEAESGVSALAQIKHIKPDFAVLDLAMPGMDGLKVLEASKEVHPDLKVIIVTSYDDREYLDRAMELGANAYLVKDSAGETIRECIETVRKGNVFISASMGAQKPTVPDIATAPTVDLGKLTSMERTVLDGVAELKTSKEIARELNISYRTVQNHRANIAAKLELSGNHQLIRFARSISK